jgi:hypothetical protein
MPPVELKPKPYISVKDAADILGCTEGRVRQLLDAEVIAGTKLHERAWAVERKSVEAYARREITVGRPRVSA